MNRPLLATFRERWRDPAWNGLAGALLVYVALGVANIVFLPRFYAPDEPRNAAYAFELWSGRLPRIPDPLPHAEMHTSKLKRSDFHASAQHPPLYYALVGGPIKASVALLGDVTPGVKAARGITLAMGLAALVTMFRLVRLLVPSHPAIAVAAVGVFASVPQVSNTFGIVYNDALGMLTAMGLLHASLAVLLQGPTRRRLVEAGVWMALASLTRFAGVLTSCFGLLAIFLSAWVHDPGGHLARARTGVVRCLPLVVAMLATSGWFYVRSLILYGDVTGARILFEILDRPDRGSALHLIVSPAVWGNLHDQLWRNMNGGTRFDDASVTFARSFTLTMTACAAVAVARVRPLARLRDTRTLLTAVVLALFFVGTVLPPVIFHSKGGSLMVRYCYPALVVPCVVAGVGFAAFRTPLLAQVTSVLLPAFALFTFELYAVDVEKGIVGPELGMVVAAGERGMPRPQILYALTLLGVVAGSVLLLRSLTALHRRVDDGLPSLRSPSRSVRADAPVAHASDPSAALVRR